MGLLQRLFGGPGAGFERPWLEYPLLAVDLEMNSLDPETGAIVSIGAVGIEDGEVCLSTASHWLIEATESVGESAIIHGITDTERRSGVTLAQALTELQAVAADHVLIFHHAFLDLRFLEAALDRLGLQPLDAPHIDTMKLEQRRLERSGQPLPHDSLLLSQCRQRYDLPVYPAHNALHDALSTAELAIVQFRQMSGSKPLPLSSFVERARPL
ncbi:MAG: DNA polymerase III subunit epsilon [unclassified Hahellaceae]|nr:DNA polymerase III subunit epsilon [Hahellaceae bacterium]|tara:strand:- start:45078 stop:45716 length:639 start_codon:yes stop_codon:yes gene_type:complete